MPNYRLIIDIATNRIIYHTDDADQPLHTDEYSALVTYVGDLPNKLTTANSWSYRFVSQKIVEPPDEPGAISLLDKNKASVKAMITQRTATLLNSISWATAAANQLALQDANRYLSGEVESSQILEIIRIEQGFSSLLETVNYAKEQAVKTSIARILEIRGFSCELLARLARCANNDDVFAIRAEFLEKISKW